MAKTIYGTLVTRNRIHTFRLHVGVGVTLNNLGMISENGVTHLDVGDLHMRSDPVNARIYERELHVDMSDPQTLEIKEGSRFFQIPRCGDTFEQNLATFLS
jgi:hypothetical protein